MVRLTVDQAKILSSLGTKREFGIVSVNVLCPLRDRFYLNDKIWLEKNFKNIIRTEYLRIRWRIEMLVESKEDGIHLRYRLQT